MSRAKWICVFLVVTAVGFGPPASAVLVDFEGISSLADLSSQGITFSSGMTHWVGGLVSVLVDPDGGPVSPTHGLCVGNCGPGIGSIYFNAPVASVSLYALSGPGPDNNSPGVQMEAFDQFGNSLGVALASTTVQFHKLTISASGIRRLDLTSPLPSTDAWDDLEITWETVPTEGATWGAIKALYNLQ